MALANMSLLTVPGGGQSGFAFTSNLGTLTTNTNTDHVDTLGFPTRFYVMGVNGITNSCTFELQGSTDGTNFATISGTSGAVTAGSNRLVHLTTATLPRYVRVTVTSANANGTTFTAFGER